MAGALGNCYDRLVLGHVRDFVHFHVDPIGFDCAIFNFADNMLVAGAVVLMLLARARAAARVETEAPASAESATPTSSSRSHAVCRRRRDSDVVIERELVGMRADAERLDLVGLLVPDPGVDHVGGEDVAAEQELVVGAEGVERGFERARGGRDVGELFGLEVVDVLVERVARAGSCSGCRRAPP